MAGCTKRVKKNDFDEDLEMESIIKKVLKAKENLKQTQENDAIDLDDNE
jgi:hypothetical protein